MRPGLGLTSSLTYNSLCPLLTCVKLYSDINFPIPQFSLSTFRHLLTMCMQMPDASPVETQVNVGILLLWNLPSIDESMPSLSLSVVFLRTPGWLNHRPTLKSIQR